MNKLIKSLNSCRWTSISIKHSNWELINSTIIEENRIFSNEADPSYIFFYSREIYEEYEIVILYNFISYFNFNEILKKITSNREASIITYDDYIIFSDYGINIDLFNGLAKNIDRFANTYNLNSEVDKIVIATLAVAALLKSFRFSKFEFNYFTNWICSNISSSLQNPLKDANHLSQTDDLDVAFSSFIKSFLEDEIDLENFVIDCWFDSNSAIFKKNENELARFILPYESNLPTELSCRLEKYGTYIILNDIILFLTKSIGLNLTEYMYVIKQLRYLYNYESSF